MTSQAQQPQATDTDAAVCCTPSEQQVCCEPSEKEDCCGPTVVAPASCGCQH